MTLINVSQLQETIESQKRVINALQQENRWYQEVIFNPSMNEIDMRLLVKNTPREMRMGLCAEFPEKKIYLPEQAEAAHCSPKVASQHLRTLARQTGAFAYRDVRDDDSGNTRVVLQPLPPAETPAQLTYDRAKRGGSTWEDGKRVKRCKCGSTDLTEVTKKHIVCNDCGEVLEGSFKETRRPVNDPDCHIDTDPDTASEADCENEEVCAPGEEEADCHIDTDPPAEFEISNLPPSLVYTQRIDAVGQTAAQELQAAPQWVVWRYGTKRNKKGKLDKLPFDAKLEAPRQPCDYTKPASWATSDQALAKLKESHSWARPYDGIGFCFKEGGGLVGLDRDGSTAPLLPTYGETSVSGAGQHQIAHGILPRNLKCSKFGIELYDHDRFFTWTGDHLPGTPEMITDCQTELDALYKELAPAPIPAPIPAPFTCSRSDDEILEKARSAPNGAKFAALWEGNTAGYGSQSEADLALCRMLAYWSDNTVSTIERLFSQSGLKRDKWERADYRERTINRALGQQQRRAS